MSCSTSSVNPAASASRCAGVSLLYHDIATVPSLTDWSRRQHVCQSDAVAPARRLPREAAWHDVSKALPAALDGLCHLPAHAAASRYVRLPARDCRLCADLSAKTFVMRILYMPKPMLLSDLDLWVRPDAKRYDDLRSETPRLEANLAAGKRTRRSRSSAACTSSRYPCRPRRSRRRCT